MYLAERKHLLLVLLFFCGISSFGQSQEKWECCIRGAGIAVDSFCVVADEKFGTSDYASIDNSYVVKNIISLNINENALEVLPSSFSLDITLYIRWVDSSNTVHTEFKTLHVNYDSTGLHHDTVVSYYGFNGGHIVVDSIVAINATNLSLPLPDIFSLCNTLLLERSYSFSCDYNVVADEVSYLEEDDELLVSWQTDNDGIKEETEFDLEWTFYDDSSQLAINYLISGNGLNLSSNFYNNASRVVVKDYHYQIPLLYENGYLVFRIRPVKVLPSGQRIVGLWTSDVYANSNDFIFHNTGHEDRINWQASTTFAEEGKRKSVVSYFDGASKNRQTTTKINSDSIPVAAETMYDFEGRPVISTLPTPVLGSRSIQHFDFLNTNLNSSTTTYNWVDLDSASGCLPTPRVMNNANGSSRYYSAQNPLNTTSYHQFIPNANGYPFSQTQYTADLTNRVQASAGPGSEHHMRETNPHVTRYLYGGAEKSELVYMFAHEAGIHTHYFKNLVIDPNGQIAITYTDMHGRTIATALAGDTVESGMYRLPNYKDAIVLRDTIIDSTNQTISDKSINGTKTFIVSTAGIHKFYYNLAPKHLIITACDSSDFCFDCVYDLKIRITDNCGNHNLPGDTAFIFTKNNYNPGNDSLYYFDTLCTNEPLPIIDSFELYLQVGSYTVSKSLAIQEKAIDYYYNYYYRTDTCIKRFQDFYSEALSGIDVSGCNMTCASCLAQLGDSAVFIDSFLHKILVQDSTIVLNANDTISAITAYFNLKDACDILCDSFSVCDFKRGLMISDVTPGTGQYAGYTTDSITGVLIATDKASMFNNASTFYPHSPLYQWSGLVYRDERGVPDTLHIFDDVIQDTIELLPNSLTLELFVKYWKPSWANALFQYHPEICNYTFCVSNSNSHDYDQAMMKIDNYDTAVYYGFLNPLNHTFSESGFMPNTTNKDPFFYSPYGSNYRDSMYSRMNVFQRLDSFGTTVNLSIWDLAARSIDCNIDYSTCFQCKKQYYWIVFRSFYLGMKKAYVDSGMVRNYIDHCSTSGTYLDFNSDSLTGKTPRFELIWTSLPPLPPDLPDTTTVMQSVRDSINNSSIAFRCTDYAPYWWAQIKSCGFDSATVINEFVKICQLGTDNSHPYGASSTPGPTYVTPNGNRSFEDVLHWADSLSVLYMTPDSNNYPSANCTGFLINNPQPYGVTTFYYQNVTLNRPDSCVCANINSAAAEYYSSGDSLRTLSQYLTQIKQIVVSEEDIQLLLLGCNDSVCTTLKHPVAIPYEFDCDKVCVNCYQLITTYEDFLDEFPQVYSSPNYFTLMQSYMNSHLAMNLTALEYMDFMYDSCEYSNFPFDSTDYCLPPISNNDSIEAYKHCTQYLNVLDNDVLQEGATLVIVSNGMGYASIQNGKIRYNVGMHGFLTNDTIKYAICNACNICDTSTVFIAISGDCNNPPVAVDDYLALCDSDVVVTGIIINDIDIDDDTLALQSIFGGSHVAISQSGNNVQFTALSLGSDTLTYIVCDSTWGTCDTGNVIVVIQNCDADTLPSFYRIMPITTQKNGNRLKEMLTWLELSLSNGRKKVKPTGVYKPQQDFVPFKYAQAYNGLVDRHYVHNNLLIKEWGRGYTTPDVQAIRRWMESLLPDNYDWGQVKLNSSIRTNTKVSAYKPQKSDSQLEYENNLLLYKDISARVFGGLVKTNGSLLSVTGNKFSLSRGSGLVETGLLWNGEKPTAELLPGTLPGRRGGGNKPGVPLNEIGSFTPYFSIDSQANWCDSVAAAISDWESQYPTLNSRNRDNFLNVMFNDLGVLSTTLDYWYNQIDTCGLPCPDIIDCTAAANVMDAFDAQYPALTDSSFDWLFTFYLNQNAGSGAAYKMFEVSEWKVLLSCCGVSYPATDTLDSYCDSVTAITSYYSNSAFYNEAGLYILNEMLADLTGGSCDIYDVVDLMAECNIAPSTVFPCTKLDSMMTAFEAILPAYADTAPEFIWSKYYLEFGFSYSNGLDVWKIMMDSCDVDYPVVDNDMSYCDSLNAMVDWYNEVIPNQYMYTMVGYLNDMFGRPTFFYDSIIADINYWETQFDSCGTGDPYFVNCVVVDSILNDFREENPMYADSCSPSLWANYLNSHSAAGSIGFPDYREWIALLDLCDIEYPLIDTTNTLCDSVLAGVQYYYNNYENRDLWKFMNGMATVFGYGYTDSTGWVPYTYDFYLDLIDSCGLPCPYIIDCNYTDSVLNDFYATYPGLADTCPPAFWAHYLNEHGAGGVIPGVGYLWYTDPAIWMRLFECCDIAYPEPDTLVTLCDSVTFVVDNYSSMVPAFALAGLMEGFKDVFDGYYTGPGDDAPMSFWTSMLDSCGYNCGDYVPCTILDSVIGDFYYQYPQYTDSCPPWVITTYLNVHVINSLDYGTTYNNWQTLYTCCSQTLPDPDTTLNHCDTMFVVHYLHGYIDSMFKTMLSIPCTPSWAYNLFMLQRFGLNVPISTACDSTLGCGFECPDTCVLSSFCDSLVSVYTIMTDLLPIVTGGGGEGPEVVDIVNMVMGTSYSEAEMYVALATCDTNFCAPIDGLMSYVGPVFESYDSCMPSAAFTGAMAGVTGLRMDYGSWCNLLSNCGHPCPDTCDINSSYKCDSVRQAYQLYQHIHATLGGSDTTQLIANVFTAFFGYPISYTQYLKLKSQCDTTNKCGVIVAAYNNTLPLFELYDTCAPTWAVEAVLNANMPRPGGGQYNYAEICSLMAFCHLPCPDTCAPLGNTNCDSILSVYTLYRNVVQLYGVYIDTINILNYLQTQLLDTSYPYNTFMLMAANCRCPELAVTFTVADSLLQMVGPCAPQWYVQLAYGNTLGLDPVPTYAEICEIARECGLPCPDTCPAALTHCDTILELHRVIDSIRIALGLGISNPIVLNNYTSYITTFVLGYSIPTFTQLTRMADSCNVTPICDKVDSIQLHIRQYLASHHGALYLPQQVFNDSLYSYLNDAYNLHAYYVNWCDSLVACGDTCPLVKQSPYLCGRPLLPPIDGQAEDSCLVIEEDYAYITAAAAYQDYLRNLYANFVNEYVEKCLGAYKYEHFDYKHPMGEYHFTLYYYDQAGNLVKTIPPIGFDVAGNANHTYATVYRYNTLNQPVEEHTPDAGNTYRWYDLIGKPVFSQNAQQIIDSQCSYTLYDRLQRITEVGRFNHVDMSLYDNWDAFALAGQAFWYPLVTGSGSNPPYEVTRTYYDEDLLSISNHFGTLGQQNLRNRVATATYEDIDDLVDTTYNAASHYSYDVHGNVKVLLQQNNAVYAKAHRFKRLDYQYDLISGKVNNVVYQRGQPDQFIHRYVYDADNRITDVYTSRDSTVFTHDAHYQYYLHGPLARIVLGEHQVQGIDYAYTIQGWLKLINSSAQNASRDMGHDGVGAYTARDAYGYSIGYFNNDYRAINNTLTMFTNPEISTNTLGQRSLYNGNIAHTAYFNKALSDSTMARTYRYDQLNRLISANTFAMANPLTGSWHAKAWYKERLSYDPNGNILTNYRNGEEADTSMDDMEYHYIANTNKLDYVTDAISAANYATDIDNQSTNNYQYDAIGNLTKDVAEGIDDIQWTVYGKIRQISKANGDTLRFAYDATGNRICKEYYKDSTGIRTFTYYQRDATGNIMATYQQRDTTLTLTELPMYGSSRLGTVSPGLVVYPAAVPDSSDPTLTGIGYFAANFKQYELTNHLGNVLSTISDRKLPVYLSGTFNRYEPEIVTAQDYYSFGSLMPGRHYSSNGYKFGYSGQEKDDEVLGAGNLMTAQFWEYDTRIGRRWNLDPVPQIALSDYSVNRNNPIYYNDPNGDCPNCATAAIGAGVGALIGGGIEIGMQLYKNGSVTDWKAVGGSVLQGGITGGAAGFTGGASLFTTAAVAGTANGVGGVVNRTVQGKPTTVMNVVTDVSIGAVFGAGGKYLGDKFGLFGNKTAPSVDDIFTNSVSSRGLAEKLAQVTKYKGFQNANEVLKKNNPVYDLFDNAGNVVDVTTTSAQKLGTSQFTNKLDALAGLGSQFKNRTLQIYVKAGQYSKEELASLKDRLSTYISTELKGKNVSFSIDQVKK